MAAAIRRLVTRPERLRRDQSARLVQALLPFAEGEAETPQMAHAGRLLLAEVARLSASSSRWEFVMISPVQFGVVLRRLRHESVRPAAAMDLWGMCFRFLLPDTGEVFIDRAEFCRELGLSPRELSRLLGELVKFDALLRDGKPGSRAIRYFVNPNVGTSLSGAARDAAQAAAPVLELVGGFARPTDRRARAPSFAPPAL